MRALVVLPQPPLLEGSAPGRCTLGMLQGLETHGVEVQVLAARLPQASPGEPPADLAVEVVDVDPPRGWRGRAAQLRRPHAALGQPVFSDRVRDLSVDADVVHLDQAETAWADVGVGVPTCIHLHYRVRLDRALGLPWQRAFRQVLGYHRLERAAIRRHRHLVASSPVVARGLRAAAPGAEVVVAPLTLDPAHYPRAPLDGPPVAGIIGTAAWPPTEDAVRRLVERVWPKVRRHRPDARLLVAGWGTDRLGLRPRDGVEVLGPVGSAGEFLRGLSVLVHPLGRGSGMKVKVLEAIASGVPVVTTSAGAEGIEAGDGIVVERDDDGLAAAAASVLGDAAERGERGAAALEAFRARYSPRPATEPLVGFYRRMAEHASRPARR